MMGVLNLPLVEAQAAATTSEGKWNAYGAEIDEQPDCRGSSVDHLCKVNWA